MRILSFTAENFKKIRVVEIVPKGTVTTITGRNGQGKTSVLDALWALFAGKKAIPDKPVRKGAEKSRLQATLGDDQGRPALVAKRVISGDRTTSLTIEAAPGAERPAGTPQTVLDALIGEMSFDPVEFVRLGADASGKKKQIEILRSVVRLDLDLEKMAEENAADYRTRSAVNAKVSDLRAQAAAIIFSPGLPRERVDEEAIKIRKREANQANASVVERIKEKTRLASVRADAEEAEQRNTKFMEETAARISAIQERELLAIEDDLGLARKTRAEIGQLAGWFADLDSTRMGELVAAVQATRRIAEKTETAVESAANVLRSELAHKQQMLTAAADQVQNLQQAMADAIDAWENAPWGELIDLSVLDEELDRAQLTNREIGKRERRDQLEAQAEEQQRESARLTHAMEAREERKREALAAAKMPVDGLTFTDEGVRFHGVPLDQLGEAEQIRVGCALAMAANPKLRCVPIARGESLDDESLALIEKLAEEHDFQIFMAKVDTTGKVGIVLEDGMVQAVNE
jgi:hypothetical protein